MARKLTKVQMMARYTAFEEAMGHLELIWTNDQEEYREGLWVVKFLDRQAQKWFERATARKDNTHERP